MKKLLLSSLLFISIQANADCLIFDKNACPQNIQCPVGTIADNNGKCLDCNTKGAIDVDCIGEGLAKQSCPNRYYFSGCGELSYLECPLYATSNCKKINDEYIRELCKRENDGKTCYEIDTVLY